MRALNRVVCALLAAAFATAGVIIVIEVVYAALDRRPAIVDWPALTRALARNSWNDLGPRVAAGILIAVGLLLLLLGLRRGKPTQLPLVTEAPAVQTSTTRRSLQRAMRAAALETPGVSAAKVKVGRRRAKVVARSSLHEVDGVRDSVRERLGALLDRLQLTHPLRLKVRTKAAS